MTMRKTMRTRPVLFVAGALGAAVLAAAAATAQQTLNVKLGLWEVTTLVQTSGMPPIDTSTLTPEQRARVEAMMSHARSQATPKTRRECLTQEKLQKMFFDERDDASCKTTPVSVTPTAADMKIECTAEGGMRSNGTLHVDAPTPETVKGRVAIATSGGGNTMDIASTFTARWISANCGDVK